MDNLDKWLRDTAWDREYWSGVHTLASTLKSDGCTGVPDWFKWTCLEHDCHYRTHQSLSGSPLSKEDADYILRVRIQQCDMSILKWPISWIRWFGVAVVFKKISQNAWRGAPKAPKE